jgi:hypothetical protein
VTASARQLAAETKPSKFPADGIARMSREALFRHDRRYTPGIEGSGPDVLAPGVWLVLQYGSHGADEWSVWTRDVLDTDYARRLLVAADPDDAARQWRGGGR